MLVVVGHWENIASRTIVAKDNNLISVQRVASIKKTILDYQVSDSKAQWQKNQNPADL